MVDDVVVPFRHTHPLQLHAGVKVSGPQQETKETIMDQKEVYENNYEDEDVTLVDSYLRNYLPVHGLCGIVWRYILVVPGVGYDLSRETNWNVASKWSRPVKYSRCVCWICLQSIPNDLEAMKSLRTLVS